MAHDSALPLTFPRAKWQIWRDRAAFPLLCFLSSKASRRIGFTPIDEERLRVILPNIKGKLLDIGCGTNELVGTYGNGIGVDVYPWAGADLVVEDAAQLPFASESFDTVTFVASLNHIANREAVLAEAYRVLKPQGKVQITMLNPMVSWVCHTIRYPHDPDQTVRGMAPGEVYGFWRSEMLELLSRSGFRNIRSRRFVWGLNCLYSGDRA